MDQKYISMLWRFVRVFLSSFFVSASILLANVTQENLIDWKRWGAAVLMAGMVGGISALGKFIRDEFGVKLPL